MKRELKGISKRHLKEIKHILGKFLDYVNYSLNQEQIIQYIYELKNKYSISRYRKEFYQIRKFLNYLGINWLDDIELPPEPECTPRKITKEMIRDAVKYFENNPYFKQIKALILLGATSGLRAEELYQLEIEDIDLENRTIYVKHEPEKGKTTKTGKSRVSFFTEEAKQALVEYLQFLNNNPKLKKLFSQTHIERQFRNAPIKVKELRKFFSQEWERRNGSYAVKELLMGHSLKKNVDLQHYAYLDEEDLRGIYEKVFGDLVIIDLQKKTNYSIVSAVSQLVN